MEKEAGYSIKRVNDDTWIIEEEVVRFFLLKGTDRAFLIDSGMYVHNAREIAESLTSLPISLLNTHADIDHIGSTEQFEFFYLHPDEKDNFSFKSGNRKGTLVSIHEGDVFDLGGRKIEIIHLPGHTPGSIAILDVANRVLISGDPIQDGRIYMNGPYRDLKKYIESLKHLEKWSGRFDEIWPSHGTLPVDPSMIESLREGAEKILAGNAEDCCTEEVLHGNRVKVYDIGVAKIICAAE